MKQLGALGLEALQSGSDPEPTGQIMAALVPTENPGNRAEVSERALTSAPRGTRPNTARLKGIDRRGFREVGHETRMTDECGVGIPAGCREKFAGLAEFAVDGSRLVVEGNSRNARLKQLQIVNRGGNGAVFLGNGLPLLCDTQVPARGALRQSGQKTVGRSCSSADCAAASVKEADFDTCIASDLGQGALRLVECPLTGEDTAILVAIAVADHDLLNGQAALFGGFFIRAFAVKIKALRRDRMYQELPDDAGSLLQVIEGLEKRDNREVAHEAILRPPCQAGLPGEEVNSKQVGKTACHTDDEGSDAIDSMFGDVVAQDIVAGKDIIRFSTRRSSCTQERARRAEFFFQKRQASIFAPLGELVVLRASCLE